MNTKDMALNCVWRQPSQSSQVVFDEPRFKIEHDPDFADFAPALKDAVLRLFREAYHAATQPWQLGVRKPGRKVRR